MIKDNIKNANIYYAMNPYFEAAFKFIAEHSSDEIGKYEIDGKNCYAMIQEYETKPYEDKRYEGHQNYLDIQYIISGNEKMYCSDIADMGSSGGYNPEKDIEFYENVFDGAPCKYKAGEFAIFYPSDIHKPGCSDGENKTVRKIVVKIKL